LKNNIIQIISEDCRTFQIELDNHQEIFSNKDIKIISDKNKLIINIDSRKIYIPEIKHSFDFRDIQIIELKEIINNINNKIKELTDNIYTPNFGRIYGGDNNFEIANSMITSKYKDRYIIHQSGFNHYIFNEPGMIYHRDINNCTLYFYIDNYGCYVMIYPYNMAGNMYHNCSKYPLPDNVISMLKSNIKYVPQDMITLCNNISKDYYEKIYKLKIFYEDELSINYNKLLDIISKYEK
jgi:hypothetical protein